jgi:serine phosphatase RsbU (regulator of sigma subunit)
MGYLKTIYISVLLMLLTMAGKAQELKQAKADTNAVRAKITAAQKLIESAQPEQAIPYINAALQLADELSYLRGKSQCLFIFGKIYRQRNDYYLCLKNLLYAENVALSINDQNLLLAIYAELAEYYFNQYAHYKTIEYLDKAIALGAKINQPTVAYSEKKAKVLKLSQNTEEALRLYVELLSTYKKQNNSIKIIEALIEIVDFQIDLAKYTEAIAPANELASYNDINPSKYNIARNFNNLGFLFKRTNETSKALTHFESALSIITADSLQVSTDFHVQVLLNIGTIYTNLKNYAQAKEMYLKALQICRNKKNRVGEADALNYIAANFFISGNNPQALINVNKALDIAEKTKATPTMLTSYRILKLILTESTGKADIDNRISMLEKEVASLPQNLKDIQQKNFNEANRLEENLKNGITSDEENTRNFKRIQIEAERRKQEMDLQTKEIQNQRLEQERTRQLLALTQANARADELEKSKQIQDLLLKHKDAEQEQRKKEIKLLEKDKQLQNQRIEEEIKMRRYAVGMIILVVLILLLVLISFIISVRNKRKLEQQNIEITRQNEQIIEQSEIIQLANRELEVQKEEIIAQVENVEKMNMILQTQNKQITSSISAAKEIQEAILPNIKLLDSLFKEHFILYYPKDVVSGDFYWAAEIDNCKYLSVVDCTGHGVPGAFMSMIGKTMLDRIILVQKNTQPSEILEAMHQQVFASLKQDTSGNKSGMDMILIKICKNNNKTELTFAGAKRPLYIKHDNQALQRIDGSRKSIGGKQNPSKTFSQHTIPIETSAVVYLCTDGYTDQNDKSRQKIGSKRLITSLEELANKSLPQQKAGLEQMLLDQLKGTEQRDDILFMGIRV